MLVLARKVHQRLFVGSDIIVKILSKDRNTVKLAIEAPNSVPIYRQEIYEQMQRTNRAALTHRSRALPKAADKKAATKSPLG